MHCNTEVAEEVVEEVGLSGEDVNLVEVDEEEQLSVKEGMLLSANVEEL